MSVAIEAAIAWHAAGSLLWLALLAKGHVLDCWRTVSRAGTAVASVAVVVFWPIALVGFIVGERSKEI